MNSRRKRFFVVYVHHWFVALVPFELYSPATTFLFRAWDITMMFFVHGESARDCIGNLLFPNSFDRSMRLIIFNPRCSLVIRPTGIILDSHDLLMNVTCGIGGIILCARGAAISD